MQTENLDLGNSNRQELLLRNFRNAYFYKQRDDMTFKDSCSTYKFSTTYKKGCVIHKCEISDSILYFVNKHADRKFRSWKFGGQFDIF